MDKELEKLRLNAKNLFLTYPQCDLSPEEVLHQLKKVFRSYGIEAYCVCSELHNTPKKRIPELEETRFIYGRHIHALISLKRKVNFRDARDRLKLVGTSEKPIIHGHYQGARDKSRVLAYITKKENYISTFNEDFEIKILELNEQEGKEVALRYLIKHKPKLALTSLSQYERNLTRINEISNISVIKSKYNVEDYDFSETRLPEYIRGGHSEFGDLCYVLIGDSGLGKTQAVRAYLDSCNLKTLNVTEIEDLRKHRNHDCWLFDDANLSNLNLDQRRLLFDRNDGNTINARYQNIPLDPVPYRIFLGNSINAIKGIQAFSTEAEYKSLTRRLMEDHITKSLIKPGVQVIYQTNYNNTINNHGTINVNINK